MTEEPESLPETEEKTAQEDEIDLGQTRAPFGEVTFDSEDSRTYTTAEVFAAGTWGPKPQPEQDPVLQVLSPDALMTAMLGEDDAQFRDALDSQMFSFSIALIAMTRGLHVARASWKVPGKYVFLQPPVEFLRDPVTDALVPVKQHLAWKNGDGQFVPWLPSQDAILARDWFLGRSGDYPFSPLPPVTPTQI